MDDLDDDSLIPLTTEERISRAIAKLPVLSAKDVPLEDSCPICLMQFSAILDGLAQNEGSLVGVTPNPVKLCGVTKLDGCGHIFCRVDLIEWIRGRHGTCPACRHAFLDIKPMTDSDGESSDGDYIPDDEDEDEDDAFVDTEDDWDFETEMDLDTFDEEQVDLDLWGDHEDGMDNLGLSDGASESMSEGDIAVTLDGETYVVDNTRVFTGEEERPVEDASTSQNPSVPKQ